MQNRRLDIEALLSQRQWLRELARSLARSEADADDLAQGALALALAHPLDAVRAPRAWLAHVVRNLAARNGRAERARAWRERRRDYAALSEATDQAVANTEVYRLLSELVLALEEPYRSTVMLRYYEGLSAAEIGRQVGVPASTVRTRLERGLARLRATLAERDPKARWLASLAPIGLSKGGSVARAGAAVPVALATDGARRVALVCGLLALVGVAGVGLFALRGGGPRAPLVSVSPTALGPADRKAPDTAGPANPLMPPAATDARVAAADPEPPASQAGGLEAPVSAPAAPTETLPPGTLAVVVTVNGAPRTEGVVILDDSRPGVSSSPSMELCPGGAHGGRERRLDERGRAEFQNVSAGEWWLAVSATAGHAQQLRCTMPEGAGHTVEVELTSGAVYGDAYDDEGAPIADAWVALSPTVGTTHWQFTRTGVNGAYRMEFVRPGPTWILLVPGAEFQPNRSVGPMLQVNIPRSGDLRHDFGALGGLRTWRGRVVTRAGGPLVAAATLHLQHKVDGRYIAVEVAAGTGAFEQRLGRGTWSVQVDDQLHPAQRRHVLDLEIAEADVEGEVVWPGTRLSVELSGAVGPPPTWVSLREPASRYILWKAAADGDQRWVFDGVQPGEWLLTVGDRSGTLAERRVVIREVDVLLREPVALQRAFK